MSIKICVRFEAVFYRVSAFNEVRRSVIGGGMLSVLSVQPTKGGGGRPKRTSGSNTPEQELEKKGGGGASSTGSNSPGERAKKRVQVSMGLSMACIPHAQSPCCVFSVACFLDLLDVLC